MKGYELIKAITERKIKNNTTIKVKMGNAYKATLKYENLMLKWESGDFDTSILCSTEANFEVIEENKEIDTINAYKLTEAPYMAQCLREKQFDTFAELLKQSELEIVERVNDLVYAVKELIKEREEK